jgi:hypothetical protein
MKLFVLNPDSVFLGKDISKRSKVPAGQARPLILGLKKAGLVRQKTFTKKNRKIKGWQLDSSFPLYHQLKNLLDHEKMFARGGLLRRFGGTGRIKLIITAGIFIDRIDSRIDLFLVGDALRLHKIDVVIRKIEADTGKEIRYAVANTDGFLFRLNAHDRFIRDILDYPHDVIVDKIGLT